MNSYVRVFVVISYALLLNADGILENTVVMTSDQRSRLVEAIEVNSPILSLNRKTLRPIKSITVRHKITQTVDAVVNIQFANGDQFSFSPYQRMRIFSSNKWVDARKLNVGDRIALRNGSGLAIERVTVEKNANGARTHVLIMSPGDHILAITPLEILTKQSDKVAELQELLERKNEAFAAALARVAAPTPWKHKSAQIYTVTEDLPQYGLHKGDLLYLDKLHFDHLEIFNSTGTQPVTVLNLDGTKNEFKERIARAQERTLTQYMS